MDESSRLTENARETGALSAGRRLWDLVFKKCDTQKLAEAKDSFTQSDQEKIKAARKVTATDVLGKIAGARQDQR